MIEGRSKITPSLCYQFGNTTKKENVMANIVRLELFKKVMQELPKNQEIYLDTWMYCAIAIAARDSRMQKEGLILSSGRYPIYQDNFDPFVSSVRFFEISLAELGYIIYLGFYGIDVVERGFVYPSDVVKNLNKIIKRNK